MISFNERQKNIAKILLCIGIGLAFYIFAITSSLSYETNDDPASMILLGKEGSFFSPLFAKPLSLLISVLYGLSGQTPWWIYITLITISASLGAVIYVILRRFKLHNAVFISLAVIFFFLVTAIDEINFTRTAATAAVAGIALIVQGISEFKINRVVSLFFVIFGTLIWLWGAMIRDQIAFAVIPFAGLFLVLDILSKRDNFKLNQFISDAKEPVIIALSALLIGILILFLSGLLYTKEERQSIEYYKARISVQDYADNYPSYEEAMEEYKALGISENDYTLIFTDWTTEDPDFFTTELFLAMRQNLYEETGFIKSIEIAFNYMINDRYARVLIAVFLSLIILSRKKRIGLIVMFSVLFAYICLLAFLGRVEGRVVEPALLYAVVFAGLYSDIRFEGRDILKKAKSGAIIALCAVLLIFGLLPIIRKWGEGLNGELAVDHKVGNYNLNAHNFYNMIAENKNEMYLLPIMNSLELLPSERISPKYQPDITRFDNLFFLGGWDARIPINYQGMAEYGVSNPIQAIYSNKNVLSGYDEQLDIYLREHYGQELSLSLAKYITQESGLKYGFFQYSMPILGEISEYSQGDIFIESYYYIDNSDDLYVAPGGGALYLSGALGKDGAKEYQELFLNIETIDGRLSYRIFVDDKGEFLCRAFHITEEMISSSEVCIVAKTSDGEYIKIQDLGEYIEI